MLDNLKFIINSKIELYYGDNYYKSIIEDVQDNFISISIPTKDGEYVPLRKGEMIEVIYYYRYNIYKFYSQVIDRKITNIPVILIEHPKEIFKIQRRKFVRVPIVCSIVYSKLDMENETFKANKYLRSNETFKAIMVDLSGSGMKIKVKGELNTGDIILASIPIETENVALKGEVVRVDKDEENRLNVYGINFIDIEDNFREKLIKFIFKVMRQQMKKS